MLMAEPSRKIIFSSYPHTKIWCGGLEEFFGGARESENVKAKT
jgi:hypothetical protein